MPSSALHRRSQSIIRVSGPSSRSTAGVSRTERRRKAGDWGPSCARMDAIVLRSLPSERWGIRRSKKACSVVRVLNQRMTPIALMFPESGFTTSCGGRLEPPPRPKRNNLRYGWLWTSCRIFLHRLTAHARRRQGTKGVYSTEASSLREAPLQGEVIRIELPYVCILCGLQYHPCDSFFDTGA